MLIRALSGSDISVSSVLSISLSIVSLYKSTPLLTESDLASLFISLIGQCVSTSTSVSCLHVEPMMNTALESDMALWCKHLSLYIAQFSQAVAASSNLFV